MAASAQGFSGAGNSTVRPNGTLWSTEEDQNVGSEEITAEVPEENEAAPIIQQRKPDEPSLKEWEEHLVLHTPFRAWCPHCVKGRANNEPHWVELREQDERIPVVAIDYMWMKSRTEKELND